MQATSPRPLLGTQSLAMPRSAILVGALCLSMACGGARAEAGGTTPADHPEVARRVAEPIDYLPADSFVVARLDLNRLHQSPYITFVNEWLELAHSRAQQSGAGAIETYDRLMALYREADSMILGVAAFQQGAGSHLAQEGEDHAPPRIVIVLHGQFQQGELENFLRNPPGGGHSQDRIETRDGRLVLTSRNEHVHILLADQNTVVMTIQAPIEGALAVANGADMGLAPNGPLRALASQAAFGQHALDLAVLATPEARQALAEGTAGSGADQGLAAAFAETLESLTGQVSVSDGFQLGARIQTSNRLSAAAITVQINAKLDEVGAQPALALIGLADAVHAARARVDGTASVVELSLDDSQTRRVFERLNGLVALAIGMMGQQHSEGAQLDDPAQRQDPNDDDGQSRF